jgi:hypothetical protein
MLKLIEELYNWIGYAQHLKKIEEELWQAGEMWEVIKPITIQSYDSFLDNKT